VSKLVPTASPCCGVGRGADAVTSVCSQVRTWSSGPDLCAACLQMENGILLPTLQSALPFLDLHGTPRLEFHQSVFDELREKLMERVATIAEGKDEERWVSGSGARG